ncbi:hypothetical protein BC332_20299 [Capsicum chinense]|nr:hypothetical protein BC332_20299 [Capsicum chinense]
MILLVNGGFSETALPRVVLLEVKLNNFDRVFLRNYVNMLAAKNRTRGSDHFRVAFHDWVHSCFGLPIHTPVSIGPGREGGVRVGKSPTLVGEGTSGLLAFEVELGSRSILDMSQVHPCFELPVHAPVPIGPAREGGVRVGKSPTLVGEWTGGLRVRPKGPYTLKDHEELSRNTIKALWNADISEGIFVSGKDVSLRNLGGKRVSQCSILSFFAGNMHSTVRPKLLKYWRNKDESIRIYGALPHRVSRVMSYPEHMKSSKYCLCPMGYEVNSPRIVEALYYECVPVIIADKFRPSV